MIVLIPLFEEELIAKVHQIPLQEASNPRLVELLNNGPFALEVQGRATDRYGRALRVVTRNGQSLGAILTAEGLAELWQGKRGNWCASS